MSINLPFHSINNDDRINTVSKPSLGYGLRDDVEKKYNNHIKKYKHYYKKYGLPASLTLLGVILSSKKGQDIFRGIDKELVHVLDESLNAVMSTFAFLPAFHNHIGGMGLPRPIKRPTQRPTRRPTKNIPKDDLTNGKTVKEQYNTIKDRVKTHLKKHEDTYKKAGIGIATALALALGGSYLHNKYKLQQELEEDGEMVDFTNYLGESQRIPTGQYQNVHLIENMTPEEQDALKQRVIREEEQRFDNSILKIQNSIKDRVSIERDEPFINKIKINKDKPKSKVDFKSFLGDSRKERAEVNKSISQIKEEAFNKRQIELEQEINRQEALDVNRFGDVDTAKKIRTRGLGGNVYESYTEDGQLTPFGRLNEETNTLANMGTFNRLAPSFLRSKEVNRLYENRDIRDRGSDLFIQEDESGDIIPVRRTPNGFKWEGKVGKKRNVMNPMSTIDLDDALTDEPDAPIKKPLSSFDAYHLMNDFSFKKLFNQQQQQPQSTMSHEGDESFYDAESSIDSLYDEQLVNELFDSQAPTDEGLNTSIYANNPLLTNEEVEELEEVSRDNLYRGFDGIRLMIEDKPRDENLTTVVPDPRVLLANLQTNAIRHNDLIARARQQYQEESLPKDNVSLETLELSQEFDGNIGQQLKQIRELENYLSGSELSTNQRDVLNHQLHTLEQDPFVKTHRKSSSFMNEMGRVGQLFGRSSRSTAQLLNSDLGVIKRSEDGDRRGLLSRNLSSDSKKARISTEASNRMGKPIKLLKREKEKLREYEAIPTGFKPTRPIPIDKIPKPSSAIFSTNLNPIDEQLKKGRSSKGGSKKKR